MPGITPINSEIPLQGVNPVQTLGDLAKVDNIRSEMAYRQKQAQVADQQMQAQQLQIQQTQKDTADQNTIQEHMADPANQDALRKGDLSGLYGKVQPKTVLGLQQHLTEMQKNAAALDETTLKNNTARHDTLTSTLSGLLQLPEADRAAAYAGAIQSMQQSGVLKGMNVPGSLPDYSDATLNKLAGANSVYHGVYEGALKDKKSAADLSKTQADTDKATADTAKSTAELPEIQAKAAMAKRQADAMAAMTPDTIDQTVDAVVPNTGDSAALNARTKAQARQAIAMGLPMTAVQAVVKDASDQLGRTETAVRTAAATVPTKVSVYTQEQGIRNAASTPDQQALDLMAEKVLAGENPPGRSAVQTAAVYKRAAEMAASRGMTTQQAVLEGHAAKANTQALGSLTKQYETLKPFAEMADKNADILEKKMADVSDLGTSLLNTPIRDIEGKFGSTKVAGLKAALLPVQADFARILNSPTGGGVLSDNARHEMEQALPPGATVGQIKAALDVFRTDNANRKASYDAAVKDLTARTVSNGRSTTDPNAPANLPAAPPPPPNAAFRKEYQGHIYTRQTEKDPWTLAGPK